MRVETIGNATLYLGDALDLAATVRANVCITDPPYNAGRKFIGIELDEHWFDVACKRIEAANNQRDLFVNTLPAADPADARVADLFAPPEAA